MNAILAAAIIFVVFAVGDLISAKTIAIVSLLLFASVVFLACFWTGIFPTTMFADSTLLSMAGLRVTMLRVHLGTTIKLRDFGAQWRTVIISAVACIAISAAVFFIEDDAEISYNRGERVAVTWVDGWEVVLPYEAG